MYDLTTLPLNQGLLAEELPSLEAEHSPAALHLCILKDVIQ